MTAEKSVEANGVTSTSPQPKNRARKAGARRGAAKRKPAAAAAGSRATKSAAKAGPKRSGRNTAKKSAAARTGYAGAATRLLRRGKRAAGGAYEWAAEGASRALPLAARGIPDQRMVQKLADERPYMLGAIGLGIGAMIGLMLPSPLGRMNRFGTASSGRSGGRSRR